jgi:hypothetical protein
VRDIGALLDCIEADARFDARRVMAHVGAVGGDMVCASLAEYGDRVAGGVSIVGISPFRTFDGKTHP